MKANTHHHSQAGKWEKRQQECRVLQLFLTLFPWAGKEPLTRVYSPREFRPSHQASEDYNILVTRCLEFPEWVSSCATRALVSQPIWAQGPWPLATALRRAWPLGTASSVAEPETSAKGLPVLLLQNSVRVETMNSRKIYYTSMSGSREVSGKKRAPSRQKRLKTFQLGISGLC